MKRHHGFTLIEILVTTLLLSTGLLGLVGLQTAGMKNTISSYNRTQATQLASSMADRMRTNVADAGQFASSTYITTAPDAATQTAGCLTTTGCTPAQMAQNDLYEWNLALTDTSNGLAKTGTITYAAPVFVITITWGDGLGSNSFVTEFQL